MNHRANGRTLSPIAFAALALVWSASMSAGPAPAAGPTGAAAQPASAATTAAPMKLPALATVTGRDVPVRCGADHGFYVIGHLQNGQVVRVIAERNGFARVRMVGPAFKEFFGYVKTARSAPDRLRLSADGATGLTLGMVEVVAPNVKENNDAAQSWKPLTRLEAEQSLRVLRTFQTDTELVHQVALPETAECWMAMTSLRPATEEEQTAWHKAADEAAGEAGPGLAAKPDSPQPPARTASPASADKAGVLAREESTIEPPADARPSTPAPGGPDAAPPAPVSAPPVEPLAQDAPPAPARPVDTRTAEERRADQLARLTVKDLDGMLKQLQAEDPASAEIDPLRQQYLAFAQRHADDKNVAQYATVQAERLKIWGETQRQLQALADARARARLSARDADATVKAMNTRGDYAAIGRLDASTIYDGQRLPALFRIRDFHTGRTLAYLSRDEEGFNLSTMLGQTIGVVGDSEYDNGLRLNIIKPRRIDLLAPPDQP